jgi:hypothetical protein
VIAYLEIFDQWKQVWDHHRQNHRRPHRRRFYKIQDTPSYIGCGAETVRGFKPKGILQKITLKSRKNLHARPGLYKTFSGIQRQQLQNAIAPSYGHQTQQCHAQDQDQGGVRFSTAKVAIMTSLPLLWLFPANWPQWSWKTGFDKALHGSQPRHQRHNLLLVAPRITTHIRLEFGVCSPPSLLVAAPVPKSFSRHRLYSPRTCRRRAKHIPPVQKHRGSARLRPRPALYPDDCGT